MNVLPASIAERLKASPQSTAEQHDDVTIVFSDIVGFTPLSESMESADLVALLNEIVADFDGLAELHGVEKIKTIGDAYMVASGVPVHRPDHAAAAARFCLDICRVVEARSTVERQLSIRVGMYTGSVVAGVIGTKKFAYDLWGDVVNTAARMESHGVAGRIQLGGSTREAFSGEFELEARGEIDIKGKGRMPTWFLLGPASPGGG